MIHSAYKINFSDYFDIDDTSIICDSNKIRDIIYKNKFSVYPECLNNKLSDVLDGKIMFKCGKYPNGTFYEGLTYNGIILKLPTTDVNHDIIIYSRCGSGDGLPMFKQLIFKDSLKEYCKQKLELLKETPYLCIHVRNTDYASDYKALYELNKTVIHSYDNIYIATDDKKVIDYFRSKNLNIHNFNVFPTDNYYNLHFAKISPDDKIKCLICDIFIATNSDKLISNSLGGFTRLLKKCFSNKREILSKFY